MLPQCPLLRTGRGSCAGLHRLPWHGLAQQRSQRQVAELKGDALELEGADRLQLLAAELQLRPFKVVLQSPHIVSPVRPGCVA